MVSERGLGVLKAIIEDYVASREPVASKTLVERHDFGVSSATIRNDMAALEEEELIQAPHTSSGRIPTDKGYRVFVNRLSEVRPLSTTQRQAIETFLDESSDLGELLSRTVRVMAQLTGQLAVVQYPNLDQSLIRHIELVALEGQRVLCVVIADSGQVDQRLANLSDSITIESLHSLSIELMQTVTQKPMPDVLTKLEQLALTKNGEQFRAQRTLIETVAAAIRAQTRPFRAEQIIAAGAANLVRTEIDFAGNVLSVIDAIEEQVVLLRLFSELHSESDNDETVHVSIGRENAHLGLAETSIISSTYDIPGRDTARIGVVGPTRMDYQSNIAAVRAVAHYLSRNLELPTRA